MSGNVENKDKKSMLKIEGLSLWNVYFVFALGLYWFSYISFNVPLNIFLAIFLCLRFSNRWLNISYNAIMFCMAIALLYHESYLPGPEQIFAQKENIQGFSTSYILELVLDFINIYMVYALVATFFVLYIIKDWVRVSSLTFIALFALLFGYDHHVENEVSVLADGDNNSCTSGNISASRSASLSSDIPEQRGALTSVNLENYYQTFIEEEKSRRIVMPTSLSQNYIPFDIVIINICSMANDDIEASGVSNHKLFSDVDLSFTGFNSAASYSTPASLRLLRANCGFETESEIYSGRKENCELMSSLQSIGFSEAVYMDHNGNYGEYLDTLKKIAGLNAPINDQKNLTVRYRSFDGSPIYSDTEVFEQYMRDASTRNGYGQISFFNLISLHDGNHFVGEKMTTPYGIRISKLLDDVDGFIASLENANRRTMVIIVPEHGAAIRGDRMQIAKLREIPTDKITNVPMLVRFVGIDKQKNTLTIDGSHSYMAISELVKRVIENNYYSSDRVSLQDLLLDLPQTAYVSEGTNALFMKFKNKPFFKLDGEEWMPYKK